MIEDTSSYRSYDSWFPSDSSEVSEAEESSSEEEWGDLPVPQPLFAHTVSTETSSEDFHASSEVARERAPPGSMLRDLVVSIGPEREEREAGEEITLAQQLIGISGKDLKENFKRAWRADSRINSGPLRWLKRGLRIAGLALGMVINVASRVVALGAAAAFTAVAFVGISIFAPKYVWKNPRQALAMMFGVGAGLGAMTGALTSTLGNLLINVSIDKEINKDIYMDAVGGNAGAAALGGAIAITGAIANPLLWRAAWVK